MGKLRRFVIDFILALGLGISGVSCADLQQLESGVCGNFVIDEGEDCDGHPLEIGTVCVAPDKPNACRQVCSASTPCPTGWGCGYDGICRASSGIFAQLGDPIPLAAPNLIYSGDFDGDAATDLLILGHENLIGTRPARIAYSQPNNSSPDIRALSLNMASPFIGDVSDQDTTKDVAFATPDGISLLEGVRNRGLSFGIYSFFNAPLGTLSRVVPMNVREDEPGDEFVLLFQSGFGQTTVNALESGAVENLVTLSYGLDTLAGAPGRGKFNESAPCEALVFAFRGANQISVYWPCRMDGSSGWNATIQPKPITLPMGVTVDGGVLVADIDQDGHQDILIDTNTKPHIAWGLGNGTFTTNTSGGTPDAATAYVLPDGTALEFPLAVGKLNGDALTDFVTPRGVLVSNGGTYEFGYRNLGDAWTTAIIADFNANGFSDVIAGSSDAIDCTFLNNTGMGLFNPDTLPTDGPVAGLAVGDFDGDLINDVVVTEAYEDVGGTYDSEVTIAYGQPNGAPGALVTLGRLENAVQVEPAIVSDPVESGTTLDGIADLVVVNRQTITTGDKNWTDRLILFRGNGSRTLYTSRPLTNAMQSSLPLGVAVAKLGDETPEVVAVGSNSSLGNLQLWVVESTESDITQSSDSLADDFHAIDNMPFVNFQYGAYLTAGDLDHSGVDEVVMIAPYGQTSSGAAIVIADYDAASAKLIPRKEQPIFADISIDSKFELHDVDGDGNLDALIVTGSDEVPGDLIVLWGDGVGGLNTTAPEHFYPESGVNGFACLSTGEPCRLVLSSPSGIYSAHIGDTRRLSLSKIDDLPGAVRIATGDFDRDGVVDMALQTTDGLVYYRSLPVIP